MPRLASDPTAPKDTAVESLSAAAYGMERRRGAVNRTGMTIHLVGILHVMLCRVAAACGRAYKMATMARDEERRRRLHTSVLAGMISLSWPAMC